MPASLRIRVLAIGENYELSFRQISRSNLPTFGFFFRISLVPVNGQFASWTANL